MYHHIARLSRGWHVLRIQGPRRFMAAGIDFFRRRLGYPSPAQARYLAQKQRADRTFDGELGVATGGIQYLHDLTIASRNARFGVNHIAVDPIEFERAMARVDIDLHSATFVDLGSGKGRALLMAARLPFARIIGVEFASELHTDCLANLRRAFPDDRRITAILGDAADFAFPAGPLVVYLFNPFDAPVMAAVARNALAAWRADPRPIRVIYLNPVFARKWLEAGWEQVEEGIGRAIFAPRIDA